jgi:uncharacterized protein YjbJ (UPF0337 family)
MVNRPRQNPFKRASRFQVDAFRAAGPLNFGVLRTLEPNGCWWLTKPRRIAGTKIASSAPLTRAKGAVRESVGKVTGDIKTEAEGAAEKAAGKVQNAMGAPKMLFRILEDHAN